MLKNQENLAVRDDDLQVPAEDALAIVVRNIAEDARREPSAYLSETIVPQGGE